MSIRLVAVDVDPEEGVMLHLDFNLHRRYVGLPHFLSTTPFHRSPCTIRSGSVTLYDMIWWLFIASLVRYVSQSHHYYDT